MKKEKGAYSQKEGNGLSTRVYALSDNRALLVTSVNGFIMQNDVQNEMKECHSHQERRGRHERSSAEERFHQQRDPSLQRHGKLCRCKVLAQVGYTGPAVYNQTMISIGQRTKN